MRSTKRTEEQEIDEARTDLAKAREGLHRAHAAVLDAHATVFDPLSDAEDDQWVRVALAERRERAAEDAALAGERRRNRTDRLRALVGLPERYHTTVVDPLQRDVHEATVEYLQSKGEHDSSEDMHPGALDPEQSTVHAALDALEERNAHREERDS